MNSTCCTPSQQSQTTPGAGVTETPRKPYYTVQGNPEAYEVRVQMPGVPKGSVQIDLEDNVLSIRGERQSSSPEGWKSLHREISTQSYLLRLKLNTPVEEDKLVANLQDGVLTLKLPVKEAAKPRRITVE